jgi:hypothetical protein
MLAGADMVTALWHLTIVHRSRRRVSTASESGDPCRRQAAHPKDRAQASHLAHPYQAVSAEDERCLEINHEA